MSDDALIIIRKTSERTFQACQKLAQRQEGIQTVKVVSGIPFETCLRNCYQEAIQSGHRWTMTLDADVLLRDGAAAALIREAEKLPKSFAQVEGRVLDKLTGTYRFAGNRVYRTALLEKALDLIPEPGTTVRPETETIRRLNRMGHPSRQAGIVMGLHDFEQSFEDIYRKACLHSYKHRIMLSEMLEYWEKHASEDSDYLVAIHAFCEQLLSLKRPVPSAPSFSGQTQPLLETLGLTEKPGLDTSGISFQFVESVMSQAGKAPVFAGIDYYRYRSPVPTRREKLTTRIKRVYAKHGFWRFFPILAGIVLERCGKWLLERFRRIVPEADMDLES